MFYENIEVRGYFFNKKRINDLKSLDCFLGYIIILDRKVGNGCIVCE